MSIVAVTGDVCTTTTLAVAATWRAAAELIVVEADPTGGDMAAWLDLPTRPSLVTAVTTVREPRWEALEPHAPLCGAGLRVVACPWRQAEAQHALAESVRCVVPALASDRTRIAVVDIGKPLPVPATNPFAGAAAVTVLVHRQSTQSAAAAAVRLRRLVDRAEGLSASSTSVLVAVVGRSPFGVSEVSELISEATGGIPVVGLPIDPLAAASFGGRAGVSARRLARLPLMRAAAQLAQHVEQELHGRTGWSGAA